MIASIFFFLFLNLYEEPDITVPNVVGMTIVNAESTLKNAGFEVATEVTYEYSDTILSDMVIGTNPSIGRSVKNGTLVTLIISKGIDGITLEDYIDKNIDTVKAYLEAAGINVIVDNEEYPESENKVEGAIISQDIKAGTIMKKGETIVFRVVKTMKTYPDFVVEDYSVEGVQTFCDDNGITLDITYKETNDKPAGSIISQSRAAGTKVVSGVTLRIVVAKAVPVVAPITPSEPEKDTNQSTDNKTEVDTSKENEKEESKDSDTTVSE